jgi:hypothetical protein
MGPARTGDGAKLGRGVRATAKSIVKSRR